MGENIYRTKVLLKKLKTLVKTRFASKVIMFEKCFENSKKLSSYVITSKNW
jgi:hypothetical protein